MAAQTEDRLCQLLKAALERNSADASPVKVCRKTKDLIHGDFVVPKGVLDIDLNSETGQSACLEATLQHETAGDILPISRLTHDKFNSVIFYIDRNKAFRNIIQEVFSAGENYGHSKAVVGCGRVVVNPVDLIAIKQSDQAAFLTQLRAVVLLKHVLQLLMANGYQAEIAKFPTTENVQELLDVFHVDNCAVPKTDLDKVCEELLAKAGTSPWREEEKSDRREGNAAHRKEGEGMGESVVLNLRRFVENGGLLVGKNGYDKNLNLVSVKLEDGVVPRAMKEAGVIELLVSGAKPCCADGNATSTGDTPAYCVHLVSQSVAFTQQQADLVWRICTPSSASHHLMQRHLVFGTVGQRKSSSSVVLEAKEFYNIRYMQMTQAAMMKYGDHDQGVGWEDMIAGLTAASITFDLLSTACSSQVQLDLSEGEGEGGVDNRSGTFVMYNCARLATLLQSFEQQVEQGVYPALPSLGNVNFQLLREEEEWTMVLLYIHGFPRLVQETLTGWQHAEGIAAHIHTHKVSHFLLNFSKTLSSYYSRYHILGGSEAHLLPLMFARLSLMKAAHQVLCNGLRLLGLQPFSQL